MLKAIISCLFTLFFSHPPSFAMDSPEWTTYKSPYIPKCLNCDLHLREWVTPITGQKHIDIDLEHTFYSDWEGCVYFWGLCVSKTLHLYPSYTITSADVLSLLIVLSDFYVNKNLYLNYFDIDDTQKLKPGCNHFEALRNWTRLQNTPLDIDTSAFTLCDDTMFYSPKEARILYEAITRNLHEKSIASITLIAPIFEKVIIDDIYPEMSIFTFLENKGIALNYSGWDRQIHPFIPSMKKVKFA